MGGIAYNAFDPNHDYGQESFFPKNRFVAYGIYDLPVGRGKKFGSSFSKWEDAILGGWQTTFQHVRKEWDRIYSILALRRLRHGGTGKYRRDVRWMHWVISTPSLLSGRSLPETTNTETAIRFGIQMHLPSPPWEPIIFNNAQIAKRNLLTGPGTWGVNLGVHKTLPTW